MNKSLLKTITVLIVATAMLAGPSVRAEWTIVASYEIPEGTSGLAFDGTWLYCGIYGASGGDVYRIDPSDGSYTFLCSGPQGDAFGLSFGGGSLWTTDHPGSSSNPAIAIELSLSCSQQSQFNLPDHYMSGIAYDNGNFWVTTYYPDPATIYNLDGTGTIQKQFTAPDDQPWDLCLENGNLWMADYWGDALYKIDTATGALLETNPSEGVDPAGIVWDGQYLWYCDNGVDYSFDYLYKIDLGGSGTPAISFPQNSHHFGTVEVGSSSGWTATVQSTGSADLIIDSVVFTGSTDVICNSGFPMTILPGNQDLLGFEWAPTVLGPLNATAIVYNNDPLVPAAELALTGDAVYSGPEIHLPQTAHNYQVVRSGANTRWFMTIENQGSELLSISQILSDSPDFVVDENQTFPIDVNVLDSVKIGIWFRPNGGYAFSGNISVYSNDADEDPVDVALSGEGLVKDWLMGDQLWSYTVTTGWDNTAKAIATMPDINGDGKDDLIICTEDDYIRCFNGNSHGTADILWEHEIYSGSVYLQTGLAITQDIDFDGYNDIVVGAAWGARLIRAISGKTGATIWTHDTHEYGDGGWVYAVSCTYDYNSDGTNDVLASTGDDGTDTGPKRVYCLDGLTGLSIWECPLGGPVYGVIGVADFTDDGIPDAVAGASNEDETQGRVVGINGASGAIEWSFNAAGSSVWGLVPLDDMTGDGIPDVAAGDFGAGGPVYGLNAKTGAQVYQQPGTGGITGLVLLDDVNGDNHPDVIPRHFSSQARVLDGQNGSLVWSHPVADYAYNVARIADVSGDGINDVLVGTLFSNNYCYFLNGTDGSELWSTAVADAVDAIGVLGDVVGDGSMEMIVGLRNGTIQCFSGGAVAPSFICGDIDNGGGVDVADLSYLVDYLFRGGPPPAVPDAADLDGSGSVDVADLTYLVDYLFRGGPEPIC